MPPFLGPQRASDINLNVGVLASVPHHVGQLVSEGVMAPHKPTARGATEGMYAVRVECRAAEGTIGFAVATRLAHCADRRKEAQAGVNLEARIIEDRLSSYWRMQEAPGTRTTSAVHGDAVSAAMADGGTRVLASTLHTHSREVAL